MTLRPLGHRRALAGAAALVALCAVLPVDIAATLAELIGIAGMVALWRGVTRNGAPYPLPFRLFAIGGVSVLVGNVVRTVHGLAVGERAPFPSPADLFFYAGYACVLVGVLGLVRRRSARIEGDNLLDAALLVTWAGALVGLFVVVPFVRDHGATTIDGVMTLVYTAFDVVLIGGMVRLAVGSGRRAPAYYLLGAAAASIVATDIVTELWTTSAVRVAVTLSAAAFVLAGAAGQHPSVARLTDSPALRDIQLTPRRFMTLVTAVMSLLLLLVLAVVVDDVPRVIITGAGAAASIFIVFARLSLLVQANERKAVRETILRDAAGELARATNVRQMHEIVAAAVGELLPGSSVWVIGDEDVPAEIAARAERATVVDDAECGVDLGSPLVLTASVPVRRGTDQTLVVTSEGAVARQVLFAVATVGRHLGGAIDGLLLAEETYRHEQEQRLRAFIEHSSDMVTVLDENGLVTFVSPACRVLLGVPESLLVGRHPFERVHAEDRHLAAGLLDRAWATPGVLDPIEVRFLHESGDWRWHEVLVENLLDEAKVAAVIVHARDVTDRRRAQETLAAREARFRSLVQHNADLIAIVDDSLALTYASPAARAMLGYDPESLIGRPITDIIPSEHLFIGNGQLPALSEAVAVDAAGERRDVELTITDLRHDPAVAGIVVNARDVSERKSLEGELRYLAMHDPLTGLANRTLLHDRLATALDRRDGAVALLYIDVDDFKSLNDTLGHTHGDAALCEVARRMLSNLRDSDLAARLGGDEFAVLLHGPGASRPMEVAERLLDAIREPIMLGHHRVTLTVSLGAAVREPDASVSTMTRDADIALHMAKGDGKDRCQLFVPEMAEAFNTRIELKRDLHDVIERGDLRLVYQPVYEVSTGRMSSVEALLRWHHPTRGLVPPLQFIPLAEESGAIVRIGSWVLDQACAQLAEWRRTGAPTDLVMSVNLSVAQLENEGLIAEVQRTLETHGLEPSALVLEVTESVLAADIDLVQLQLRGLTDLGVRLALDDFGTGYSSLGYLHHFQMDTLKIDKSFLPANAGSTQQHSVLKAIVDLAGSKEMTTTAEGVEEPAQLDLLASLGVTYVQGYLFAKPVPPDEVLDKRGAALPYLTHA